MSDLERKILFARAMELIYRAQRLLLEARKAHEAQT